MYWHFYYKDEKVYALLKQTSALSSLLLVVLLLLVLEELVLIEFVVLKIFFLHLPIVIYLVFLI